jgi:hypothetical protein
MRGSWLHALFIRFSNWFLFNGFNIRLGYPSMLSFYFSNIVRWIVFGYKNTFLVGWNDC